MKIKKIFLFTGIFLILVSFTFKGSGSANQYFWSILSMGLICKSIFAFLSISDGTIKRGINLNLILTGVCLAIASVILKRFDGLLLITRLILGIAIVFKITGIFGLILSRRRMKRKN